MDDSYTAPRPLHDESTNGETFVFDTSEIQAINASLARSNGLTARSDQNDHSEAKRRIAIAQVFWRLCNAHQCQKSKDLMADDAHIQFLDQDKALDMEMPWHIWADEMKKMSASFPDFRISCDHVCYSSGAVILQRFQAGGTHTGAPYAFGPCAPIDASGKRVANDPEEVYLFFKDGEDKISRIVICAEGEMSGPAGIYTQLGGFPLM